MGSLLHDVELRAHDRGLYCHLVLISSYMYKLLAGCKSPQGNFGFFASSLMISADGFLLVFSCLTTSGFVRDVDKANKGQESFGTSEIVIQCTNQIFLR